MAYKGYIGLIFVTAIIIGCIFISGCLEQTSENNKLGFNTYENVLEGIKMEYPASWTKIENPTKDVLVTFMPNAGDTRRGVFNVTVIVNDSLDLKTYLDIYMKNLDFMFMDYQVLSVDHAYLADGDAYSILLIFIDDEYTFKRWDTWTVRDPILYMLTFQSDITYYDEYLGSVEKMVAHFEITQ